MIHFWDFYKALNGKELRRIKTDGIFSISFLLYKDLQSFGAMKMNSSAQF